MASTEHECGTVFIFGCGAVGSALGRALVRVGVPLAGAHCRTRASATRAASLLGRDVTHGEIPVSLRRADTVVVAVPDPAIRGVAEQLAVHVVRHQVALHCSGSRSSDDLAPLRPLLRGVASFHPLLSFADPLSASDILSSAAFALEGDDAALDVARDLARTLGGFPIDVPAADRVLYHAAAATASNHLVALAAQAASCLRKIGLEQGQAVRALVPLMRSTLANLERLGLPLALTGPVSRGDAGAVRAHLHAIRERAPEEEAPYLALARRAAVVARAQGKATAEQLAEVERTLSGEPARSGDRSCKST
jgi:predicted short-subunit dehydrogenase-like oxidoreductase (DUF2520 family)